jgi:hypothetical protein
MPKKEIRFHDLVNNAGRPEVVFVWSDPKQDSSFMKAVKDNRVVTLIQQPVTHKKDFGEIGFHQDPRAAYFIFPKPLPELEAVRVVGIKYDLMGRPRVLLPAARPAQKEQSTPSQTKPNAEPGRKKARIRAN